jgi:hypothetical protein
MDSVTASAGPRAARGGARGRCGTVGRVSGWIVRAFEQMSVNRVIRPQSHTPALQTNNGIADLSIF